MEDLDPILGQAIKKTIKRPMWPKNKIWTNLTGPKKGKGKGKSKNKGWDNGFKGKDFGSKSEMTKKERPTQDQRSGHQYKWRWDDERQAWWACVPQPAQSFFVVGASQRTTRNALTLQPSAMASTVPETRPPKVLDVNPCPTQVLILDNGCSRYGIVICHPCNPRWSLLLRFITVFEPVETTFTFANGRVGK